MSEQGDARDVLRLANPVTSYAMDTARLDAILDRVAASPQPARPWRSWRLRVIPLGVGALALVAGLAAGLAGEGLPVLALASAPLGAAPVVPKGAIVKTAPTMYATSAGAVAQSPTTAPRFVARALPAMPSSATVYAVTGRTGLASVVARVAGVLGVAGPASAPSCGLLVSSHARLSASYLGGGATCHASDRLVAWRYVAPTPRCVARGVATCPPAHPVTPATLWDASVEWAKALTPAGLHLGAPSTQPSRRSISYSFLAQGTPLVDFSVTFRFSSGGSLVAASGVMGQVAARQAYPLVTSAAGVDLLNAPSGAHGARVPARPVASLTSVHVAYQVRSSDGGRQLLVPAFVYRASNATTWTVLAVDRSLVRTLAASP